MASNHHTPPYLDDTTETVAIHHGRAATPVLQKIKCTYGFSDADLAIPPRLYPKVSEAMAEVTRTWPQKRSAWLAEANLPTTHITAIDKAANGVMLRYIEAYHIREKLLARPNDRVIERCQPAYTDGRVRKQLMDIYLNHLVNDAQKTLTTLGLDPVTAHAMNAHLIGRSVLAYRQLPLDGHAAEVNPTTERAANADIAREQIAELNSFWRIYARQLTNTVSQLSKPRSR